ncbi:MAG: PhzF family phenazine biosynthesis protein [Solirubrobacterales bacterium]
MQRQFVANAFENGPFTGNPAAVVPLKRWPDDALLQAIAAQNNLSETAFFVDGEPAELRWFTPTEEIDLCGHATLATAHVLFAELEDPRERIEFETQSGRLAVTRADEGYTLDFPEALSTPAPELAEQVFAAAGVDDGEVLTAGGRVHLVLDSASAVRRLTPDQGAVTDLPRGDLFVSAPGDSGYDLATRVFAPGVGIPEDPATGAAHCAFTPYWCARLGRETVTSWQVSSRGGFFVCRWRREEGRVDLTGSCRTFLSGEVRV